MAKRKCKTRRRCKKVIQDYGPAKRVCRRVCVKGSRGRKAGKSGKGWCVYKGKGKGRAVSCHVKKRAASRVARHMRKTCRTRIRVKRARR